MVSRRSLRNTSLTPPKSINANDFNVAMYENWRLVLKERMMYGFRLRLVAGSWSRGQKSWSRPWTSRWHLQRSASTGTEGWDPGLLDHIDEETGREEQSSPTFDLHWHPVMYPHHCMTIKKLMFSHYFYFSLMITEACSQNVSKVFRVEVGIRELYFPFMREPTEKLPLQVGSYCMKTIYCLSLENMEVMAPWE